MAARANGCRLLQFRKDGLSLGRFAELLECLGLDLPDPLLGHAEGGANFLEGLRFEATVEAVAADDDRLLARVEPVKELAHLLQPIGLRQPLLVFVGSSVGR